MTEINGDAEFAERGALQRRAPWANILPECANSSS
jgi:hypothetical protein